MVRIVDTNTYIRRYVEKSLLAFLFGEKWGQKRLSPKWMIGIIRESGVDRDDLLNIFSQAEGWIENEDQRMRLHQIIQTCQESGWV